MRASTVAVRDYTLFPEPCSLSTDPIFQLPKKKTTDRGTWVNNQQRRLVGLLYPRAFSKTLAFKCNQFSCNSRQIEFHVEDEMSLVKI